MFNDNYSLAKFGDRFGHLGDEETDADSFDWVSKVNEYLDTCVSGALDNDYSNCGAAVVGDLVREGCKAAGIDDTVCNVSAGLAEVYADREIEKLQKKDDGKPPKEEDKDTAEDAYKKELEKAKLDATNQVNAIITQFAKIKCADLTDADRDTLANTLNAAQTVFKAAGAMTEFDNLLAQLTACDVKKELACTDEETQQTTFYAHPQCETKPSALKSWGVPILAGGGAGVAAWKLAKLTPTVSCLVGGVAFGATKYFIDKPKAS